MSQGKESYKVGGASIQDSLLKGSSLSLVSSHELNTVHFSAGILRPASLYVSTAMAQISSLYDVK